MAFTTEFVMGAGGAEIEEIPVSMEGGGTNTVYPLATVDAGNGALVLVFGRINPPSTTTNTRPHLTIGTYTNESPNLTLTGSLPGVLLGGIYSGTVQVAVLSRFFAVTSFTGTVYVIRF